MNPPYLLFDVGGTDVKSALADDAGNLLGIRRVPTRRGTANPAETLIEQLHVLGAELRAETPLVRPEAVGLLVCGIVDEERGRGVFSANLGWRDAPLRDMAARAFSLPVGFGHDVAMAGAAELEFGAGAELGAKVRNAVMLVIGTGIAAALFIDGRPVSAGGYAGELGHAAVPGGLDCPCGAHGCLETLGSAGAIAKRYSQASGTQVRGAREVLKAMQSGDPTAARIWDEAVEAIAFSIAQLSACIAPETVVIGGGLAQAGEALLEPLRHSVRRRLSYHREPLIVPARLGGDAGLHGAFLKASEALGRKP
ncbi:ROK family protein [Paeniglutamicibacter sp. MACA_103]|uniref:ROK family protein n=1 Tax=Paeniglutamicibacter sp. MACA_103 TaxID=3377337 RepID=UPI00389479EA